MTRSHQVDHQEQRLRYFGAVSASLSHEINNVLAIVGELSGLIDDLVEGASAGASLDPARFKTIGEKIAKHVERGKGIVGNLNRFAHTVDSAWTTFDSGAAVTAVVGVCDRFARLRKVELRLEPGGEWPDLDGSPYDFEHLVFRSIEAALASVDRGGEVSVELISDDGARRLEVNSSGPAKEDAGDEIEARVALVEGLAAGLGASLVRRDVPERNLTLALALPRTLGTPPVERNP